MSASRDWPKESAPWPLQPGNWSVLQPVPQAEWAPTSGWFVGAVVLGAGDVAAGDDRRQHEHRGDAGSAGAGRAPSRGAARASALGAAAQHEQQPEQQHRQAEVGGDELVLEALLDREPAERRLGEDEDAGGDRAADQQAVLAQAPERLPAPAARSAPDDRGRDPVGELDHRLGRVGGQDAALAQRPAVGAAARRRRSRGRSR